MSSRSLSPRRGLPWQQTAIFAALMVMELAWVTPLIMIFLPEMWGLPPLLVLVGLWAMMAGMMVIARFLESRDIPSPAFQLLTAAWLIFIGLLAVRVVLFPDASFFNLDWMHTALTSGDVAFRAVVILGAVAYLWWRAVTFLQRDLSFFIIGYDFRKGVLGLILAVSVLHFLSRESAMIFVGVFFFAGLMAVALGRTEDIARGTGDGRAAIPRVWLAVTAINTLAVLALAWAFAQVWSLQGFRALLRMLAPLWEWIRPDALGVVFLLLRMLEPLLAWLIHAMRGVLNGDQGAQVFDEMNARLPDAQKLFGDNPPAYAPPAWLDFLFSYVIPMAIGVMALAILVLWLGKRRARGRVLVEDEHARASSQEAAGLRHLLRRGADRVRDLAGMVGQFGLGRRFYAAITIRHIYGNLQKLGQARGQPRNPAWTPNDYLPRLERIFPDHADALRHITDAYNAYEYGHVSTDPDELDRLRADWEALRRAPDVANEKSADQA